MRMAGITLVAMTPADVPTVARLAAVAFPAELDPELRLHEELARPWSFLWVARDPARAVVGYQVAWLVGEELHLLNVAVEPSARRTGVGRALVELLFAFAHERGAALIVLEVRRSNLPAYELYRSLGFEVVRERLGYYTNGEDALEMIAQPARRAKTRDSAPASSHPPVAEKP